ncbi:hypothetical protein [Marinomonas sp. KMM3893]|nr:hypothetical protein [Marinomonas sp. KMM3893]
MTIYVAVVSHCCQPLANAVWRGIEVALTRAQTPDTKAPDERECAQDKA